MSYPDNPPQFNIDIANQNHIENSITDHPVSLIQINNRAYLGYAGTDNYIYYSHKENGNDNWSIPQKIHNNWVTNQPVNFASFANNLYLLHVGTNNEIYNDKTYSNKIYEAQLNPDAHNGSLTYQNNHCLQPINSGWTTYLPISVTVFNNSLWLGHVGDNQHIYLASKQVNNWSNTTEPCNRWRTNHSISLLTFKNKLYLGHIGTDGFLYVSNFTDHHDQWVTRLMKISNWRTNFPISLSGTNDIAYIIHTRDDRSIYTASFSDTLNYNNNSGHEMGVLGLKLPKEINWKTNHSTALSFINNTGYLGCIGDKKEIFILSFHPDQLKN